MTDSYQTLFIDADGLAPAQERACRDGAGYAVADLHVVRLEGPATLQCVQGLFTNDVETPGDKSLVYGAVLTVKGMILTDLWVERSDPSMTLFAPTIGADPLDGVLTRYVPPRLARSLEMSSEIGVVQLIGAQALEVTAGLGFEVPGPGRVTRGEVEGIDCIISRPPLDRPFVLQITSAELGPLQEALSASGAVLVPSEGLELARTIAGWPALGREIRDKTLPQEVRFDDIDGVSHSKGCYTGQETVARLHFRGHVNRRVVGLDWRGQPSPHEPTIAVDERDVGWVTTIVWSHALGRHIGLGVVRHEAEEGASVDAAGAEAVIVALPIDLATS